VLPDSDLVLDAIESGSNSTMQGSETVDLLLPENDPSLAESVEAWRSSINQMLPQGSIAGSNSTSPDTSARHGCQRWRPDPY
jgi:hypothetical protein